MPLMRVEIIGRTVLTSPAPSAVTPESAMINPITVAHEAEDDERGGELADHRDAAEQLGFERLGKQFRRAVDIEAGRPGRVRCRAEQPVKMAARGDDLLGADREADQEHDENNDHQIGHIGGQQLGDPAFQCGNSQQRKTNHVDEDGTVDLGPHVFRVRIADSRWC